MSYPGWSAVVTVPGEWRSRGYLIQHRVAAEPMTRPARAYTPAAQGESRQALFLAAFVRVGSINAAARESGVPAANHYRWLEREPRYARLYDEAQQKRGKKS